MKEVLWNLLGVLYRILLTFIWAALRFSEIFFAQLAKWLKEYIGRVR